MSALLCEANTPKVERIIRGAFEDSDEAKAHEDKPFETDFEHGQWFVTCRACGAQWSVNDAEPGPFDFEEITAGDEDVHY